MNRPSPILWLRGIAVALAFTLLAACDKDKDVEPPAELVDFTESAKIERAWTVSLGGGDEVMRGGLAPAADGERVFLAGREGDVLAVQAQNGRTLWRVKTRAELTGGPGAGAGVVAVGTADGEVIALDAVTGSRRWSVRVGGEILAAPAIVCSTPVRHLAEKAPTFCSVSRKSIFWPSTTTRRGLRSLTRPFRESALNPHRHGLASSISRRVTRSPTKVCSIVFWSMRHARPRA